MKTIQNKLKDILAIIGAVLATALSIVFFIKITDDDMALSEDDLLASQGDNLDSDIDSLESELDTPVDDLNPDEVEDYWN